MDLILSLSDFLLLFSATFHFPYNLNSRYLGIRIPAGVGEVILLALLYK